MLGLIWPIVTKLSAVLLTWNVCETLCVAKPAFQVMGWGLVLVTGPGGWEVLVAQEAAEPVVLDLYRMHLPGMLAKEVSGIEAPFAEVASGPDSLRHGSCFPRFGDPLDTLTCAKCSWSLSPRIAVQPQSAIRWCFKNRLKTERKSLLKQTGTALEMQITLELTQYGWFDFMRTPRASHERLGR